MLAQIESWNIARDLVASKLRVPIVHRLTGLSIPQLRLLWHDTHDSIPRSGKLPDSSFAFMTNRAEAAALAAFVGLHIQMFGAANDNPKHLLVSWNTHQRLLGELDINAAYYALRDVKSGMVNYVRCLGCNAQFIHEAGYYLTSVCPYCRTSPVT